MKVLLIILGVILLLIGILSIPFHIYAEYIESFVLYVRWLFIKIYIYPPADKKKKKKAKNKKDEDKKDEDEDEDDEQEQEKEEKKEKSENFIKVFYNNQGVPGMLELIKSICAKLKKGFRKIGKSFYIRKLWLRINVADGDSAQTGIKYGKICSAVYPSMGYIVNCVNAKNCSVKVQPDFLGEKTRGGFAVKLFIIPSKLIGSGIKLAISLGIELIKILISNSKFKSANKTSSDKGDKQNKNEQNTQSKTADTADENKSKTSKGGKIK